VQAAARPQEAKTGGPGTGGGGDLNHGHAARAPPARPNTAVVQDTRTGGGKSGAGGKKEAAGVTKKQLEEVKKLLVSVYPAAGARAAATCACYI
jgi:hypothetical protein